MTTEKMKELRAKGLSLSEISLLAGITPSAVSYRLKGKRTEKCKAYMKAYHQTEKYKAYKKAYYQAHKNK